MKRILTWIGMMASLTIVGACSKSEPANSSGPALNPPTSTDAAAPADSAPTMEEKEAQGAAIGTPGPAWADLEGTDFSPLLDDPAQPWKKAAFTQTRRDGENFRSVRTERYRYVEGPTQKRSQLFDYDVDPMEQTNQIRNRAYSEVVSAMKRMLAEGWRGALPPSP